MTTVVAGVALVIGAVTLVLMGLTATGGRRRGNGLALALGAGIVFPITWIVWYLRDQHPDRRPRPL